MPYLSLAEYVEKAYSSVTGVTRVLRGTNFVLFVAAQVEKKKKSVCVYIYLIYIYICKN